MKAIANRLPIHGKIKQKLAHFQATNRIPHIIFHGQSGSGKQTLVNEFLRGIYHDNPQVLKTNVMYVNCAHGKGIKFIRDDLKFFAKTNVHLNGGYFFKCVVLLNADHLTIDAQSALRRCIEIYSTNTRFFIIVKNKQKLLQPILSRFCDIYVPREMNIDGTTRNLHQYHLSNTYRFNGDIKTQNQKTIENIMSQVETSDVSHVKLVDIVQQLYENAVSSLDILQYIKTSNNWTELEKSNCAICFSKVRLEFRCEKLLMLYILDFIYNRKQIDLTEISFL
jgi:DNA polymerase III delta prime subunit